MSLVDALREAGYDCWLVDLRGTRSSAPSLGRSRTEVRFEDFLTGDLPAALDHIRRITGSEQVHWVGHSMGGMLLYAYEMAYGGSRIASGVTLASPPGFAGVRMQRPDKLIQLATLFPDIMGWAFRATTPIAYRLRVFQTVSPTNWSNMNPSLRPGGLFTVLENPAPQVAVALGDAMAANRLVLKTGDKTIDFVAGLATLHTPLLAFFAPQDPFVSPVTAQSFFDALPTKDKKMVVLSRAKGYAADYNHVDVVFGRRAKEEVFEPIVAWLKAHPAGKAGAGAKAPAAETPAKPKSPVRKKAAASGKTRPAKKPAAKKKTAAKKRAASGIRAKASEGSGTEPSPES
jgi:polyhydroxyalkanoate synthase